MADRGQRRSAALGLKVCKNEHRVDPPLSTMSFNAVVVSVHWKVNDLEATDGRQATDWDIGFPVGWGGIAELKLAHLSRIDGWSHGWSKEECKLKRQEAEVVSHSKFNFRFYITFLFNSWCNLLLIILQKSRLCGYLHQRSRDDQLQLSLTHVCENACTARAQAGFVLSRAPISSITVSHFLVGNSHSKIMKAIKQTL